MEEPAGNPDVSSVFVPLSRSQRRRMTRRALDARDREARLRRGHYSWKQYYAYVRSSGVAGPFLAGVVATYAYAVQTARGG